MHTVGVENEKFGFQLDTSKPMTLDNVHELLEGMASRIGHRRITEDGIISGLEKVNFALKSDSTWALCCIIWLPDWHWMYNSCLHHVQDGQSITLEPGCKFELSGAPLEDIYAVERELDIHLEEVSLHTCMVASRNVHFSFLDANRRRANRRRALAMIPSGHYRSNYIIIRL